MKYFMQPKVMNENLKAGLGRWFPAIPQLVKDDPFRWLSTEMRACLRPYITEGVLNPPTVPLYNGYSPAWGQFRSRAGLGSGPPCRCH